MSRCSFGDSTCYTFEVPSEYYYTCIEDRFSATGDLQAEMAKAICHILTSNSSKN